MAENEIECGYQMGKEVNSRQVNRAEATGEPGKTQSRR